jgi:Domain of Unknown Function with PDB structure (DUF3857)/Transglutaminase-like superfamily
VHHSRIWIGLVAIAFAAASNAANQEVQYAGLPSWILPVPAPSEGQTPDSASYRVVYTDNQAHFGSNGIEAFQAYRVKILRADALAAGNVTLTWSPDGGDARVHYVRIIRDNQVIDVLKSTKFQVLQREGFLENQTLNGELTATLQVSGLQIGDELEVAVTIRRKDPTLGDHLFGFSQLPATGQPGAFRLRMVMPASANMHWRTSPDLTGLSATTANGQKELIYELRDPHAAVIADGAPARFNIRRFIEVSDFDSWVEVSRRIWPLYDKASVLSPKSPARDEIAHIASANADPTKRMEAAMQLVQDRIRYVYIGLNGGNLRPATADETWERRFGDCKAKTALLLAFLRELGIRGEAVMVNTQGGDGINERLPTPAVFDHVLVRVTQGDKTFWLDGSRLGDRRMDPMPQWRWVLPVRSDGADIEHLTTGPPTSPDSINVIDVDATNGFDQKAAIKIQQVFYGDAALDIRSKLAVLSAEDADRGLRAFWHQTNEWIEPEAVSWRYDEDRTVVVLTITGRGKLDWTGGDADGRNLEIFGAGFTPPAEHLRPKEQDQSAPWLTNYPSFRCWATAIRLPKGSSRWKWDYYSDPINTHLGGVDYWRVADLRDGVMRTVMSSRSDVPEITAEQAEEVNKGLPTFNNNKSTVYQIALTGREPIRKRLVVAPFQADTDWTSPDTPCVPQTQLSWVPAPTAAIVPAIRSLGGVTLGLTPSALTQAKGAPAKKESSTDWIYNSVDAAHYGLLDVIFDNDAADDVRQVRMVIFSGKRGAEPAGMTSLMGRTRQSLVGQYDEPVSEADAGPRGRYLYFGNGVVALVVSGATVGYGIWDVAYWAAKWQR